MRRTPIAFVLILASLALIAAGCGEDEEETTPTDTAAEETTEDGGDGGGGATTVSMTEYAFEPSDLSVAEGDSLEVVNDGAIPHNLTVEGEDLATADLEGGASEDVTVNLAPGEYEFICTIADHEAQGMVGTLTVE
jgi:plastocyanin